MAGHDHKHDHDHDHHGHDHDHQHGSELSDLQLRVRALETVLAEKGYVDPKALDMMVEFYETKIGPHIGAALVAKAWTDPAFRKALLEDANAAIAAGWSRETNLDGRMPVGAGTTFGVTYTEATNYGSSWDHAHSITGSISIDANTSVGNMNEGGGANHEFASTGHNHGIGGGYGVSTAAWVIPSRAYVFAIKS